MSTTPPIIALTTIQFSDNAVFGRVAEKARRNGNRSDVANMSGKLAPILAHIKQRWIAHP